MPDEYRLPSESYYPYLYNQQNKVMGARLTSVNSQNKIKYDKIPKI